MDQEQSSGEALFAQRYRLQRRIGQGGMAEVLLAYDETLARQVAIKLLRQDYVSDEGFRTRFRQEARAAANLIHPNIVTVYDFGHDGGRFFLVMEHVNGTDLKTYLRRRRRLGLEESLELMIQACSGVGYAHRAGLVHCDLKPHNLLVTPDNRLKITDFGIARALAAILPDEEHEIVWGSPLYFSPEQAAGKPPSPASDVYSLGVVLYEMTTGRLPFEASTPEALTELHQTQPPLPPRQLNPDLPAELDQIIMKVLSKEPAARYRTADQLGRVLETMANSGSSPQPAVPAAAAPARDPYASTSPYPVDHVPGIDWLAIGLGLLAFLALGGLIPLWLYACLLYPSCPIGVP